MKYAADTPDAYLEQVPDERKPALRKLRSTINKNLPKGFAEAMSYGMIGWVVPHKLYPPGYHCDPKLPLPFMSIASQKHFIGLYHMGLYADKELMGWFTKEYGKRVPEKLDMGKSCVHFKKPDTIPFELIGELCRKMRVEEWIARYEKALRR
ncbi:MAG: DUF1801 domain-containing protein [Flavobacteriales bacterium]|nr:DUF1801 domain-containing protein [Flavobacteriales bacterium]MCB9170445.1 DUF1801 domain-containing protein [Flavobacteriales bacterium]